MPEILMRMARPADAMHVLALHHFWSDSSNSYSGDMHSDRPNTEAGRSDLEDYLDPENANEFALIAADGGMTVGLALVSVEGVRGAVRCRRAWIDEIAVWPLWEGRGIAELLIDEAVRICAERESGGVS